MATEDIQLNSKEPSLVQMAKDLVKAQIESGRLQLEATQQALIATHTNLMTLQTKHRGSQARVAPINRVVVSIPANWRESITQHAITCLECGAVYKQLSKRHLKEHDLTPRLYRAKYNIPQTLSLAARATTARRRKAVQETRPWEKTPRFLALQAQQAAATKKKQPTAKSKL